MDCVTLSIVLIVYRTQVRAVDSEVMREMNFVLDRWNMRMAVAHLLSLPPQVPDSWAVQSLVAGNVSHWSR